jgi:flagellar biosynthesis/type III secretory pathway protein FliH
MAAFSQACQALNAVTGKLNESLAGVFSEHKEEIARLSVEIARKILMQKVSNRDYEIESIVKETLGHAPSRQDLVVHLNPDDLAQCQKSQQQDEQGSALAGIKFVPDPNIRPAECLLESPKGIIKSLIDEHLERIGKALGKAE